MNRDIPIAMTRRQVLCQAGTGMGILGLFGLLGDSGYPGSVGRGRACPRREADSGEESALTACRRIFPRR